MPAIVRKEGEATTAVWVGNRAAYRVLGSDTREAFSVLEFTLDPGFPCPPPHVHREHEETFIVLEGSIDFTVDGDQFTAEPGTAIVAPRDVPHGFANNSVEPARMIVLFSPPGYERFFEELAEVAPPGQPPDMERVMEVFGRYDNELAG